MKAINLLLLFSLALLTGCESLQPEKQSSNQSRPSTNNTDRELKRDYWWNTGRAELENRLNTKPVYSRAKNIILFIGDGMSVSTVTAARIFDGQNKGGSGEENILSFERFPHVALVKTYNTDAQVPDSAGTASAINTGVKTRKGVLNLWADQTNKDCYKPNMRFPKTLAESAEMLGMATGIVSTTRLTHATPAAVYGHSPSRRWENDAVMPVSARELGCQDLAEQLIGFSFFNGVDVALGGGRQNFLPNDHGGQRTDGRNLVNEWLRAAEDKNVKREYVESATRLRTFEDTSPAQVLGLFSSSNMDYEVDRDNAKQPSLSEMTEFAIKRLSNNTQGYFLMVEGGRIDHAHHATNAYRALSDTQAFANAIDTALKQVDLSETLVLVTADHSHVFTMGGYPKRGNSILGLVRPVETASPTLAQDGKPYTTLGYHNGKHVRREDSKRLTEKEVTAPNFKQQTAIPLNTETHSGEDVALYAIGPWSHLVGGVLEQHTIYHIMTHALGWRFE